MKNEREQHKEMEDILKAELEKEAREILAEIEADESLQGLTMPDEAEEELMLKIQKLEEEKAAYERLSEKDKEALRLGREMQMQKENKIDDGDDNKNPDSEGGKVVTFRKKKRQTYLIVAVVAVLVMMMGMNAVGEVPLVTELKEVLFGEAEMVKVNSEREDKSSIESTEVSELDIYEKIKDTFKVDIISLDYKPDETTVLDYEIDEVLNRATIIYQCDGSIFDYRMIFNYREQVSGYTIEDELFDEKVFMVNDILVQLQEYKTENSDEIMYVAQYVHQDVQYIFNATTTLPEEEIVKILNNIKIF